LAANLAATESGAMAVFCPIAFAPIKIAINTLIISKKLSSPFSNSFPPYQYPSAKDAYTKNWPIPTSNPLSTAARRPSFVGPSKFLLKEAENLSSLVKAATVLMFWMASVATWLASATEALVRRATPLVVRAFIAFPNAKRGTVARTTSVSFHAWIKAMITAPTKVATFDTAKASLGPNKFWTSVASVASIEVNFPLACSFWSNQPMSCLIIAWKDCSLILFVSFSPA